MFLTDGKVKTWPQTISLTPYDKNTQIVETSYKNLMAVYARETNSLLTRNRKIKPKTDERQKSQRNFNTKSR